MRYFRVILTACAIGASLTIGAHTAAASSPTRARLWGAMDRYSECRHVGHGYPDWHMSAARTGTGPVFQTLYRDGAGLLVLVGPSSANDGGPLRGHSHIAWITRHGVREQLGRFHHLRDVAGMLDRLTAARC